MIGLLILIGIAAGLLLTLITAMLAWEMRHPPRRTAAYALARGLPCDPSELQLPFEEWRLDRPDGASLPVWDVTVGHAEHSGRTAANRLTAVFVHGWGHSRINMLPRVREFLPFCDRLILYDLRGHGESRGGASRLGHGEDDDLLALLERLGESRVVLVGHSMGAVIALNAAIAAQTRFPEIARQIAGIIVYGAYCEFHTSLQGRLRVAGYPTRPITDFALLVHRAMGVTPLSLRDSDLTGFPYPLLVFHGSDDAVAPLEHGERIAAAVSGAALQRIENAAHVDAHEKEPAAHAQMIAEFLRNLATPPPRAQTHAAPLLG